jgi:hypothetical protein
VGHAELDSIAALARGWGEVSHALRNLGEAIGFGADLRSGNEHEQAARNETLAGGLGSGEHSRFDLEGETPIPAQLTAIVRAQELELRRTGESRYSFLIRTVRDPELRHAIEVSRIANGGDDVVEGIPSPSEVVDEGETQRDVAFF